MMRKHEDIGYLNDDVPASGAADLGATALLQICLHFDKLEERADTERDALRTALCMRKHQS